MKTFKKILSEVAQPKPEDEKHFKEKHVVDKIPHPHADDVTFKGMTKKDKTRRADYEAGQDEDVYEAKTLDPVDPTELKGKFKSRKDKDVDNDGDVDSSDEYLHKRRKAISNAMKKRKMKEEANQLGEKAESEAQAIAARIALKHKREGTKPEAGSASAEMMKMSEKDLEDFTKAKKGAPYKVNEDAWEEIPMMTRQLQFIMYAAQEVAEYLNDCDEMCVDPEEWFQNKLAHVHGTMANLYTYVAGEKGMGMYGEEVEQDEVTRPVQHDDHGQEKIRESKQPSWKVQIGNKHYTVVARSTVEADKKAKVLAAKDGNKGVGGRIEKIRESLSEAVKTGKMDLNDGSSITVSNKDADLLNQMFKDLNAQNRKTMEKEMMKDKSGFERILGFAREAL